MDVIRHQNPGINTGSRFLGKVPKARNHILPIILIGYDIPFFHPPDNNMMQGTRRI